MRNKNGLFIKLLLVIPVLLMIVAFCTLDLRAEELDNGEWIESEIPDEFVQYFAENEYDVTCDLDENGDEIWYLVNNLEGSRIKISDLDNIVSHMESVEADKSRLESQIKKLVVCGICIIVILTGALVAVIYMWRSEMPSHKSKIAQEDMIEKKKVNKRRDYDVDRNYGAKAIKFVDEEDTKTLVE